MIFCFGIPWITTLFIEAHIEPGNPLYPLNEGVAPQALIVSSAILSSSKVEIPGRIASLTFL
mgnify:CR=1 FL=1